MSLSNAHVNIGLPVYNGENFLAEALDSLLAQTYTDLEIIISDNASSDETQAICEAYAAKDARIQYHRSDINHGAAWNFNQVFHFADGKYFQWVAHDDLFALDLLEKCVAVLENDPECLLCFSKASIIDKHGEVLGDYDFPLRVDSNHAPVRFGDLIQGHKCFEFFGLIRSSALKKTPLLGRHANNDGILLARLGLMGRFHEIPERLFFPRRHRDQAMNIIGVYDNILPNYHLQTVMEDPKLATRIIFPYWRMLCEYAKAVWQVPVGWRDRFSCGIHLAKWVKRMRKPMIQDLLIAGRQVMKKEPPSSI